MSPNGRGLQRGANFQIQKRLRPRLTIVKIPDQLLQPEVIGPLFVTPAFFATVLVSIVVVLWFRSRSERARHEVATALAERGQPVPPELFAAARKPTSDLRRGMVLVALGVGFALALVIAGQASAAGFGLIPAFTGIGYLVVWRIEAKGRRDG